MLSFKEHEKSKLVCLIKDSKKVVEEIWLNPTIKKVMEQDKQFDKDIEKFCQNVDRNEEGLVKSFTLKNEYSLLSTPPTFNSSDARYVGYVCGKSGSGKSFFISKQLQIYHRMYPKNKIYFISAKDVSLDPSFKDRFKDKKFREIATQIDLKSFNATLNHKFYNNCLFVFDDIIDVHVSLNPMDIAKEYMEDLIAVELDKNKKQNERNQKISLKTRGDIEKECRLLLSDQMKINKISKMKSETIKMYILSTLNLFLKVGRENGISVLVSDHKMFSGLTADKVISESHQVVLFPHDNVSKMKLIQFLKEKLSFDDDVASDIANNKFIKYEFLYINTSGDNFYMTADKFKMI